jgi:uncharacterized membrane protein (UPF0127 family)
MQKGNDVKTGLARRALILLAFAALLAGIFYVVYGRTGAPDAAAGYETRKAKAGDETFTLLVADTPAKQTLGLGKRDKLPEEFGMLFPYSDESDKRCFWMKDMRFDIDMIWLDENKKIVTIERGVSSDSYPSTFCPTEPAQYIVELNDGEADKAGLQVGQTLEF